MVILLEGENFPQERMHLKKSVKYAIIQARKLACKGFRAPSFNERLLFAFSK